MTVGLRSHYVASFHAAPLMIDNGRGLIVNTGHYGAVSYYHGAAYGAQKAGSDEMAADMAQELRPHNVAAVSIGAELGAYRLPFQPRLNRSGCLRITCPARPEAALDRSSFGEQLTQSAAL